MGPFLNACANFSCFCSSAWRGSVTLCCTPPHDGVQQRLRFALKRVGAAARVGLLGNPDGRCRAWNAERPFTAKRQRCRHARRTPSHYGNKKQGNGAEALMSNKKWGQFKLGVRLKGSPVGQNSWMVQETIPNVGGGIWHCFGSEHICCLRRSTQ